MLEKNQSIPQQHKKIIIRKKGEAAFYTPTTETESTPEMNMNEIKEISNYLKEGYKIDDQKAVFAIGSDYVKATEKAIELDRDETTNEKGKIVSEAMELIIARFSELWFQLDGLKTAKIDDYYNKIDDVLVDVKEMKELEPRKRYGLGLDVTSNTGDVLTEKINNNIKKILYKTIETNAYGKFSIPEASKRKAMVNFYDSTKINHAGPLDVIPLVVGIDKENMDSLLKLVYKFIQEEKISKNKVKHELLNVLKNEIFKHPCVSIFLNEMSEQLRFYLHRLAIRDVNNMSEKVSFYLEKIELLINERNASLNNQTDNSFLIKDSVYTSTIKALDSLTTNSL